MLEWHGVGGETCLGVRILPERPKIGDPIGAAVFPKLELF